MAHDAGVHRASQNKGTPISRRNVQVILPDGSFSHFVKREAAFQMVRDRKADWADHSHRVLYKVSEATAAKRNGFEAGFSDIWHPRASGGIVVWQMESQAA